MVQHCTVLCVLLPYYKSECVSIVRPLVIIQEMCRQMTNHLDKYRILHPASPPQVNIPLSTLGEPLLMGVALNHTSARRPSAEFYVRSTIFISTVALFCHTVKVLNN